MNIRSLNDALLSVFEKLHFKSVYVRTLSLPFMSLKELSFNCPIDQIDSAFVINNVERIHINDNKTYCCGDQTIGWLRYSVALKTDLVAVR